MHINGDLNKISKGIEKQKLKFKLFYVWFIFSSLENSSFIYTIKNNFSLEACLKTAVGLKNAEPPPILLLRHVIRTSCLLNQRG